MTSRLVRRVFSCALVLLLAPSSAVSVFAADAPIKVAFWNVMSGKGVSALAGHPTPFTNTSNCTDPTQPLNAWGVGAMQAELTKALSDPSVVALGLAESWSSVCGSPAHIRAALNWKANTTEHNGVALVARYGLAGAEQWQQLDTSLNTLPSDTAWVLRVPVCLNAACTSSMPVYVAHWYGTGATQATTFATQAKQTVSFLSSTSNGQPHVFVGDLNTFEASTTVCNQSPNNTTLNYLRNAGYVDAWVTAHGGAEGYTGMANRAGCGVPDGYTWKRIDYAWTQGGYPSIDMQRFGMMTPGDASPSDHYGVIVTLPYPGTTAPAQQPTQDPPAGSSSPSGDIVLYAKNATKVAGAWSLVNDATAAGGVRMTNPDAGVAKLAAAAAAPASYFDLSFVAETGRAYRLWIRGKAQNDSWQNDSTFVQFSGSLAADGTPAYRIGTTTATVVSIEESSGAGVGGWGWQDNGYGVAGPTIAFDGAKQTLRVQVREDGLSIDQIVLSPVTYMTARPGAAKSDATILPATVWNREVVLYAKNAKTIAGAWTLVNDATAAGGVRLSNPDAGVAKLASASAAPASYFEIPFTVETGRPYRLWVRGKAAADAWQNDSTFVQFSGSLAADGTPAFRIGTTAATVVSIEDSSGAGVAGWGWQDNGYGLNVLGAPIYFDNPSQTLRVQVREDGLSIDQIVLSSELYLTAAPGVTKNDATILTTTGGTSATSSTTTAPATTPTTTNPTAPTTATPPATTAPPTSPTTSPAPLRLLQWNTHHGGYGTDNIYDTNRLATWIVKMNPDVVMLNEIERFTGWGNQDQPEVYKNLLQAKTGKTWYYTFAQEWGQWTAAGKGNLILSTVPFDTTNHYELVNNVDRSVAEASITWNGRPITFVLTHLDPDSATLRLTQAQEVTTWAAGSQEQRILTGDMNAWPDQTSIAHFNTLYNDSWAVAAAAGTAVSFAGNAGQTKNGRIDYIYYSKGSTYLSVVSSQVYDTRDVNGVMPSDHRPVLTTFSVR
jgi:endonuclease/exonuclease/phosphatase family metal-dependent hydrolase